MSGRDINSVINRFKSGDDAVPGANVELEMRFEKLSKEQLVQLSSGMRARPEAYKPISITLTLDAISEHVPVARLTTGSTERYTKIRSLRFENQVKVAETLSTKNKLVSVRFRGHINYSVSLSLEKPEPTVNTASDALARIKLRASWLTADGLWRVDLTAVRQSKLEDIKAVTKDIIAAMSACTDINRFEIDLPYMQATALELEIEFVGDKSKLSLNEIEFAANNIFSMLAVDYSDTAVIREEVVMLADTMIRDPERLAMFHRGSAGLKRLLTQASSLTINTYSEIWPLIAPDTVYRANATKIYITEKADGIRAVVSIVGNRCRIITDRLTEFVLPGDHTTKHTIADGELLPLKVDERGRYLEFSLLLFDVMAIDGKVITDDPFSDRMMHIPYVAEIIRPFLSNTHTVIGKNFHLIEPPTYEALLKKCWTSAYPYHIDGIMFVIDGKSYSETVWYKWKPIDQNTIDFMCVKIDSALLGQAPFLAKANHELYALFVGIDVQLLNKFGIKKMPKYKHYFPTIRNDQDYIPIQFSPSANPTDYLYWHPTTEPTLDMRIVEMRKKDGSIDKPWEVVRIRHDRKVDSNYYGNTYMVAEMNYQNYMSPLLFTSLHNFTSSYFSKIAAPMYKPKNGFFRFIVSSLIRANTAERLRDTNFGETAIKHVVDLASGRGADLHRYQECGVQHTLFTDIDRAALSELVTRKFSIINKARKQHRIETRSNNTRMTVSVMHADLTSDPANTSLRMEQFGIYKEQVDYVNMSFALHYLCDTPQHLSGLMTLVSTLLRKNGHFTATMLDGERVFQALSGLTVGQSWTAGEGAEPKYQLKKLYTGDKLAKNGQTIEVKLPFTNEMYSEPLCNIKNLIAVAKAHNLSFVSSVTFDEYLSDFHKANQLLYSALDQADKEYAKLHVAVTFKKI